MTAAAFTPGDGPRHNQTQSVTVRVPAKVNLALSVGPLRPDGYHDLATVFHAVGLHDEVTATTSDTLALTCEGEGQAEVPLDGVNLAWRAAELLARTVGRTPAVRLHLTKGIPVAGGMAGGSADAAGALVACDALWGTGLSREELHGLAAQLGSDVPFALYGGTAMGTGRGEQITPVLARGEFHWVFAFAHEGLSTPAVFRELDRQRATAKEEVAASGVDEELLRALRAGDSTLLGAALRNDLTRPAVSLRPDLQATLLAGRDAGAIGTLLSGSGPTCAFLATDAVRAATVAAALEAAPSVRAVRRALGPAAGAHVL
ncbi:4-(cytidine 5'-diphospho)-2-C-methyl-D-erythritol kinase [Catenulispora pinisilvae]|uniref:4-(cytidine 5'-diphospho)-2-C-methyl-D-erythritol kinase n=1 Tax=Catenulispora pinisilvae TaxID=2705253 RepID=UPI001890E3DC|nr:4-(cytidine 5'-diphospho)-2-C-methyl-D-erythritol kinase [Catenulispora pinisilvae]